jgi:sugar lactone lactonase YvrE
MITRLKSIMSGMLAFVLIVTLLPEMFGGKAYAAGTYILTTVAGNGGAGYLEDRVVATSTQINNPFDIVFDDKGNMYIADTNNSRIRKVDASGEITTVAGNGIRGFYGNNVPATTAQLANPTGSLVDASGNLYFADQNNNVIRKVDISGDIITVAGNGGSFFSGDGGDARGATLYSPSGVALDGNGNLYIADLYNNRIRKVDTSGTISTVAGNGNSGYSGDGDAATAAQLNRPIRVAVDSGGNLYIADSGNNRIRMVNTSGIISTVAGNGSAGYSGDGGSATLAQLNGPSGMTVDGKGNLYIADTGNNRIRMVDTLGNIVTVAGNGTGGYSGDGGVATSSSLKTPYGVAVDNSDNLYIADTGNNRIRMLKVASDNANLSGLTLSGGNSLGTAFDSSTTSYTANVANSVSSIRVTPTAADSTAIMTVNGTLVTSGLASDEIILNVGDNTITVVVTAQDGTTQTYTVVVTRAASNNGALSSLNLSGITLDQTFGGSVYAYTATVPNEVSVTSVTYNTADSNATVDLQLNGAAVNNPVPLSVGTTTISVIVTAQDGMTQIYTVHVTRQPQLVTAIAVSSTSGTMYVGDSLQFSTIITPDNATDKTLNWSVVPDTGEATISADGLLVATKAGSIIVQATAHDGSGVVGRKVVTIYNRSSGGSSSIPSIPTPAPEQTPDPEPGSVADLFYPNVVKSDAYIVTNIQNRIQKSMETPASVSFSDIKGNWAEKTIDTFVRLRLVVGYEDGTFRPDGHISRAEFVVLLSRAFGIQSDSDTNVVLEDVGHHWAKEEIENLVTAGVITGYVDGTFRPDNTITREEMVIMISRIVNLNNVEKDTKKGDFYDLDGSYATNEIKAQAQAGIISGKENGRFDPKSNATRAEALQIILNALKLNPQLKTLLDSLI